MVQTQFPVDNLKGHSLIADGLFVSSIGATTDEISALKEQFLASLNHEMRTPLSGILGMVDLLLETDLNSEQKEYTEATRQCAESLLEIMNSTLEFSALSADQVVLAESDFPLRSMLNSVLDEFAFKAKAKGLRLIRRFAADVPDIVVGDALRLRQLLSQVASNAIKFTSHGEVEVSASALSIKDDNMLLGLVVRDTGIGIPDDKLACIFDSFRQIESGLARRYTGMGLGLAVTQKLIALMDGRISVSSSVGTGTVFSIEIPLRLSQERNSRDQAPAFRTDPSPNRPFRILVVEDHSVNQTVAAHLLRRRLYEVKCANDGIQAIHAARMGRYDLILMDLQLPKMDGIETAVRIRALEGYRNTPIIALTGNCSEDYRQLCIQRGMQGFVSKPVQSAELIRIIEQFLPVDGRQDLARIAV